MNNDLFNLYNVENNNTNNNLSNNQPNNQTNGLNQNQTNNINNNHSNNQTNRFIQSQNTNDNNINNNHHNNQMNGLNQSQINNSNIHQQPNQNINNNTNNNQKTNDNVNLSPDGKIESNLKFDFMALGILSTIVTAGTFVLYASEGGVLIRTGMQLAYTCLLFWGYSLANQKKHAAGVLGIFVGILMILQFINSIIDAVLGIFLLKHAISYNKLFKQNK